MALYACQQALRRAAGQAPAPACQKCTVHCSPLLHLHLHAARRQAGSHGGNAMLAMHVFTRAAPAMQCHAACGCIGLPARRALPACFAHTFFSLPPPPQVRLLHHRTQLDFGARARRGRRAGQLGAALGCWCGGRALCCWLRLLAASLPRAAACPPACKRIRWHQNVLSAAGRSLPSRARLGNRLH